MAAPVGVSPCALGRRNEIFNTQISGVRLRLKIPSTPLARDDIPDLSPQLIAHSFLGVSIAENCREGWILSSSAGRTIFHLSPKYLMGRIMAEPLEVYTLYPWEVGGSGEVNADIRGWIAEMGLQHFPAWAGNSGETDRNTGMSWAGCWGFTESLAPHQSSLDLLGVH